MKKLKALFVNSFFYCLAVELVEELLEELIAWGITNCLTWAITKALSAIIVVSLTQVVKIFIKKIIKRITYKEGNDKVSKLKEFFKLIFANKGTIAGVGLGVVSVLQGTGTIDPYSFPPIDINGFNLTPLLYYVFIAIGIILVSFFPETWDKFKSRINARKAEKEVKTIEKEAKKEIAEAEKLANQTQAQAEKAQLKAEEEKKAQEEKEKAEAEHRAKVEAAKAKLLADKQKSETTGA